MRLPPCSAFLRWLMPKFDNQGNSYENTLHEHMQTAGGTRLKGFQSCFTTFSFHIYVQQTAEIMNTKNKVKTAPTTRRGKVDVCSAQTGMRHLSLSLNSFIVKICLDSRLYIFVCLRNNIVRSCNGQS